MVDYNFRSRSVVDRCERDQQAKQRKQAELEIRAGRPKPATCEICGSPEKIVYDHNHETGKFRGWICCACNTALGNAKDSPSVLRKMLDYLLKNGFYGKK